MTDFIFHIFAIGMLVIGAVRGFKLRLTRQVPACFGIAFGVVCSYIFRFPMEEYVREFLKAEANGPDGEFVVSNLACILIFFITYIIFYFTTYILKYVFRCFDTGLLDNISGSICGMFRAALLVSIILNLWLVVNPDSRLLKYAMHDDGDIVHELMLLAPSMLGSEDVDELAHKIQLENAKTIS